MGGTTCCKAQEQTFDTSARRQQKKSKKFNKQIDTLVNRNAGADDK